MLPVSSPGGGPLPWTTRPTAALLRLAGPMSVSMLSYSVMTLTGTLFVARLGPSQLAGVGLAGTICFALLCFPIGLFGGAKVLMSQAVGAGDERQARAYLATSLATAVALGMVLVGLGQLLSLALPKLMASPQSAAHAQEYMRLRILGAPAVLVFYALREGRYAQGDSRSPMLASVTGNIINLALDYVLIVRLGHGVQGAATAALAAQGVEAVLLAQHCMKGGLAWSGVTRARLRTLWAVGGPSGLQYLLEIGSFATLTVILASLSDVEMAAHQVTLQVIQFSFLPAVAVGEAAAVLVGQAVGAGRDGWVRRMGLRALAICCAYTACCAGVMVLGRGFISTAFTSDLAVRHQIERLLWVAAGFQLFDAATIAGRNALRGAGDVRYCAVAGVLCTWLILPPLAWLLGVKLGLGALGGWIGISVDILVAAGLFWARLWGGKWRPVAERLRARLRAERRDPLPAVGSGIQTPELAFEE